MIRLISACCLTLLLACGTSRDQRPAEEATGDGAAMGDAADESGTSAIAGTWTVRVMPADKDTTLLTFTMHTTAGTEGWTMDFPARDPVPVRVLESGADGYTIEAGPYESALRKGVQVSTHSELRLDGDKLVGTTTAHYEGNKPDSVLRLRLEGTRAE